MKKVLHFIFSSDSLWSKFLICFIYIFVYDYLFYNFIFLSFNYLGGIDYIPMDIIHRLLWIVYSIFPVLFYNGIKKISSFFTLFLYLFVYIPVIHALTVIWNCPVEELLSTSSVLCVLFCLYFLFDSRNVINDFRITPAIPFTWIGILTTALTIIFIAVQFKKMHFVNPISQQDLLYNFREQNSEDGGGAINYISGWLFGGFYPFLLVNFLKNRKWLKATSILGGYLVLFMVDMQKITFFMPIFLSGLYFLIKTNKKSISRYLHSWIMVPLCIIGLVLSGFKGDDIIYVVASFVILRTICVSGWLTQMYVHFFQFHPFTYYNHISIVNFFTHSYPYDVALGKIVANNTQNANATFFLTDGYAAQGVIGIVVIGIIFLIFLTIINAIVNRYQVYDIMIVFLPCLSYLLNTSIFTTLLSNGMFITVLLLCCTDNTLAHEDTKDYSIS